MEARKQWDIKNKLSIIRMAAIETCVSYYTTKPPYDVNELEEFSRDILKGHEDAIEEITSKARERISRQNNR